MELNRRNFLAAGAGVALAAGMVQKARGECARKPIPEEIAFLRSLPNVTWIGAEPKAV